MSIKLSITEWFSNKYTCNIFTTDGASCFKSQELECIKILRP